MVEGALDLVEAEIKFLKIGEFREVFEIPDIAMVDGQIFEISICSNHECSFGQEELKPDILKSQLFLVMLLRVFDIEGLLYERDKSCSHWYLL